MRGRVISAHRVSHAKDKSIVCTSSNTFLLVSLTLFTALWLEVSLSNEFPFSYEDHIERSLAHSIRHPPRTFVAFDEFFKKPPSDKVISEFFNFDDSTSDFLSPIKPFWTCESKQRKGNLVYIHMHRSAGFTIRALLRAYGNLCGAGVALISHCLDVSHASMEEGEFWMNEGLSSPRQGKECWLSYLANRTGEEYQVNNTNSVTSKLLKENNVDIFGDHLPVGTLDKWKDANGNYTPDVRYITFFREPLQQFVSHHIIASKDSNRSVEEVADRVFAFASSKLQAGQYLDKISNHFMTPDQKRWIDEERIEWTHERRANLTMKNLLEYNVMIGLVERFPESLKLLQYLIDGNGSMSQMFEFFSSPEKIDKMNDGSISASRNRTASIVSAIKSNNTRRSIVDEYIKYERKIYEYATKLHRIQYARLPKTMTATSDS